MCYEINDSDRRAAEEFRALFADVSGFWLKPGDDTALYALVARHRAECEQRVIEKLNPLASPPQVTRQEDSAVSPIRPYIRQNALPRLKRECDRT